MTFPADIGGRQSMSSRTSRVFPPSARLPQLGTAGPPPGLSCLEYHGMPRRALGEAGRGVLQLSFHMSPPHFKQQGYGGCRFHIFLRSERSHFPPVEHVASISSLGNIWESRLRARSAFSCSGGFSHCTE